MTSVSQDIRRLHDAWSLSFDRSRSQSIFENICRDGGQGLTLLGEGRHFAAYRVKGEGLASRAPMDMVVKRANTFFPQPGSVGRRSWLDAMRRLAVRRDLPLVPPFALLGASDGSGELGLAMPFGADEKTRAAPHWLPWKDWEETLARALAPLGLVVDDQIQARVWDGVPFVIDLSDLRR